MHKPFETLWQKNETLIIKKHISRSPVRQRAAFFRRCGKRRH